MNSEETDLKWRLSYNLREVMKLWDKEKGFEDRTQIQTDERKCNQTMTKKKNGYLPFSSRNPVD